MKKDDQIKYYTYQLDMNVLNILSIVLFIFVGGIVYFLEWKSHYVIHCQVTMLFVLMFFWLILHELLHGMGFYLFKSVLKKNITFGMFLEKGVFYCMCKQKITKKVILTSLFFPVTIIGFITLIIGMWLNHYELVFLSILNIVSSIGDIVMIVYFLKAPNDIVYLDLDDCTSFTVISRQNLANVKVLGIRLDKTGIYDEKTMCATDKRKLVISKASYYLVGLILILIIINLVGGIR